MLEFSSLGNRCISCSNDGLVAIEGQRLQLFVHEVGLVVPVNVALDGAEKRWLRAKLAFIVTRV